MCRNPIWNERIEGTIESKFSRKMKEFNQMLVHRVLCLIPGENVEQSIQSIPALRTGHHALPRRKTCSDSFVRGL